MGQRNRAGVPNGIALGFPSERRGSRARWPDPNANFSVSCNARAISGDLGDGAARSGRPRRGARCRDSSHLPGRNRALIQNFFSGSGRASAATGAPKVSRPRLEGSNECESTSYPAVNPHSRSGLEGCRKSPLGGLPVEVAGAGKPPARRTAGDGRVHAGVRGGSSRWSRGRPETHRDNRAPTARAQGRCRAGAP